MGKEVGEKVRSDEGEERGRWRRKGSRKGGGERRSQRSHGREFNRNKIVSMAAKEHPKHGEGSKAPQMNAGGLNC